MTADGEARLLRERIDALESRLLRRLEARPGAGHRLVGQVFSQGAIPTTSGKFYACHPVTVTGTEAEGSTPTLTADTSRALLVDLLGGTAVAGDYLICRRVEHRWVARRTGSPPIVNHCTNCAGVPATLSYSGIYPDDRYHTVSTTLTYGAVPSAIAGTIGYRSTGGCFPWTTTTLPLMSWYSPRLLMPNWAPSYSYLWLHVSTCNVFIYVVTEGTTGPAYMYADKFLAGSILTGCSPTTFSLSSWQQHDCQSFTSSGSPTVSGSGARILLDSGGSVGG